MHIDFQGRSDSHQFLWMKRALRWLATAALISGGYGIYARHQQIKPSGGSIAGLILGVGGYALILFAGALGLRKRLPKLYWITRRSRQKSANWKGLPQVFTKLVAPVRNWMSAHLWVGLLSYPIIIFHAGFTYGSGLARFLMWLLTIVVFTGIWGAILQHFIPQVMTDRVTRETIYAEIDSELEQLKKRAEALLEHLRPSNNLYAIRPSPSEKVAPHRVATMVVRINEEVGKKLRRDYVTRIQPYLARRGAYRHILSDPQEARKLFKPLHDNMPELVRPAIAELEDICAQKRDLDTQSRMHRWLHGWLLIHVPASVVLIVLGAIHAWRAVRNG